MATVPSNAASSHRADCRSAARVLVVEDCPSTRWLLTAGLTQAGCHVDADSTGEDALERLLASGEHYDLLVSDAVLAGPHGNDLATTLLDHVIVRKVVLFSAFTPKALGLDNLDPAVYTVLPTPFDFVALYSAAGCALASPSAACGDPGSRMAASP